MNEEAPLATLAGVGPRMTERLGRLGLFTVRDLAEYLPRGYLDWGDATSFGALRFGQEATVDCTVERIKIRPTRRRNLKIVEAVVADAAGSRAVALWFNQAYLVDRLPPGTRLLVHGELEPGRGLPTFKVERHEVATDGAGLHTLGLVPLYPASEDVSTVKLRELTEQALVKARWFPDALPADVRQSEGAALRADALAAVHRPERREQAEQARKRLAFEEVLLLQLGFAQRRREREEGAEAPALGKPGELITRYRAALPFTLTPEQEKAIAEIDRDLRSEKPMQRLLQGDVGSGKTVVALYVLLRAVERGHQGALMAPTETLAEQHFLTVEAICRELGVTCSLLTSSVPARERRAGAGAQLVVGTHALIQEGVPLDDLAVAVVDEQHRFGVEQRQALVAGRSPHALHMTATPIPRTLALTVYGDLQVSEIAKPPADRKPVVTRWIPEERASEAYRRLARLLREGRQAYVVCPLIEQSETSRARAAEQEAERLHANELRGFRVGCVHGKLRPADRRDLMARFKARELDVLVATTVIEVGVDIANATVMIVQEADRFGLAQLHQLRGRVGRGAEQSYCLLVSRAKEELTEDARRRLEALVDTTDGFALAEIDLELRGEGQLLGTRQHGLTDFRFARLRADRPLLERARAVAAELVDSPGPLDDEVDDLFGRADVAA